MGFFSSSIDVRNNTINEIAPKLGDADTTIRLLMRQGDVYYRANQLNEGEKFFLRALELSRKGDSPVARLGRSVSSVNLMCAYLFRGDEKQFTRTLKELFDGGDILPRGRAGVFEQQDIFLFLRTMDRFYKTLELEMILKAVAGNQKERNKYLGMMALFFTNYAKAIKESEYFKSHPDDMLRARLILLRGVGNLAILGGKYPQAMNYFSTLRKVMELFPKQSEVFEDRELKALIILDMAQASGKALPDPGTDPSGYADGFVNTLQLYHEAFSLARDTSNYNLVLDGQENLAGFLIEKGDLSDPQVRELLNQSLDQLEKISRDMNNRYGMMIYYFTHGRMKEKLGHMREAADSYEKSLDVLEEIILISTENPHQRLNVLKKLEILYKIASEACIKSNQPQQAFQIMNRLNQTVAVSSIDLNQIRPRNREIRSALTDYSRLRDETRKIEDQLSQEKSRPQEARDQERIDTLSQTLARTKSEFYQSVNRIRSANPDYAQLVSVQPAVFSRIQQTIPQNTVLVQYLPTSETLYIFVVTRDNYRIEQVNISQDRLFAHVRRFRQQMTRSADRAGRREMPDEQSVPQMEKSLESLYQHLVAPIREDLEGKEVLAIIPTGQLYYLPFQALGSPGADGKFRHLVMDYQVVYLTSLELYQSAMDKTPGAEGTILAIGDPDGSLKNAGDEARNLREIFPGATVLVGDEATKDRVQNPPENLRILHLATHGFLDGDDVNRSYILMAGSGDRGRLTQGEIFEIPLQGSSLVTLSACQTAMGERFPGSEIASLASAFSIAGSPSVVASLWPVEDYSTSLLMSDFYSNLKEGNSRGEALRRAQAKLIADGKYSHPFYWAPFILLGDWR